MLAAIVYWTDEELWVKHDIEGWITQHFGDGSKLSSADLALLVSKFFVANPHRAYEWVKKNHIKWQQLDARAERLVKNKLASVEH